MSTNSRQPTQVKTATFALGCFWGPDAHFGVLPGVIRTRVGYAGGEKEDPTYYDLGHHTETVQIDYNPSEITYQELLKEFWNSHRPTQRAPKRQYMSIIFYKEEAQKQLAEQTKQQAEQETGQTIYTEIRSLEQFHRAEDYHQKWNLRQKKSLFEAVRSQFSSTEEFVNSTLAARVNGFVSGYGSPEQLEKELPDYPISDRAKEQLRQIVEEKKGTVPEGCGL